MTTSSFIDGLQWFGYTARQAAFLRLVMQFGGYFVRRHVTAFLGGGDGGLTTDFVRQLVARRHATCAVYQRETRVLHVFAKPLYAAIGEPDNRNRRAAEPATIVRKLLTIDVVLAHKTEPFLATAGEKIDYFGTLGVPASALPTTRYEARGGHGSPTLRHFVDKAPIWRSEDSSAVFAYVRTPFEGLDGLRTWLAAYAPLLARLQRPRLLIASTGEQLAHESVTAATAVLAATTVETTPPAAVLQAKIEAHFEARRRLKQHDLTCLSPSELDALRADSEHFRDGEYDYLLRPYLSLGPTALSAVRPVPTFQRLTHVQVVAEVLPVRYELFGTVHRPLLMRKRGKVARTGGTDLSARSAA